MDTSKYLSKFPYYALESSAQIAKSRLAWCYGDLGIGIALWQAYKNTRKSEWKKEALDILLHSAKRRDLDKNSVVDPGICHGSAGIAHIFNRMYQSTGVIEFKETSNYWFNTTLEMARFNDGLAGYKSWTTVESDGWVNRVDLLEGIAGIGLTFISAISNISPDWDNCLLID